MIQFKPPFVLVIALPILFFVVGCKTKHAAKEPQIVEKPAEMDKHVGENIQAVLQFALDNSGNINDSIHLDLLPVVNNFYKEEDYINIWSTNEVWQPLADSLYNFIEQSKKYGLFPNDYHFKNLKALKVKLVKDSVARTDATLWTQADLMLTDGFMQLSKHLKEGRLLPDSLSLSHDSTSDNFFIDHLKTALAQKSIKQVLDSLEPKHKGYLELKNSIPDFLDSMDRKTYTYVVYPNKDSLALLKNLRKRFIEEGLMDASVTFDDSIILADEIKKVEKKKGLKPDGKISAYLIKKLNSSDVEKFKRIAITLDRFKQLPPQLPEKYIWVNLPSYYLQVWDADTVALTSKIIVGKPTTRTPTLNSYITNMVTYPKWTIPESIIKKDVLPGLKKSPGYLARKGFSLVDSKGETVDPYSVNWTKYSKGIPYKVVQGSGDANALGIYKFNFNNPYSVYLHDTNQRYLFKNTARALSHGCVRVQEWEKLAFYIARNDSINLKAGEELKYNTDSIINWLANKEKKTIMVKNIFPLFIRYFTCEGKDGKIIFYDDIYNEDKILREKYFANRN